MKPAFVGNQLSDGTRFIKYRADNSDLFLVETRDEGIFSVSISSSNIEQYYALLGRGKDQVDSRILPRLAVGSCTRKTVGEIDPKHHGDIHQLGMSLGANHSHWGGLGKEIKDDGTNGADGYIVLALLCSKLGNVAWQMITLARV